MPTRRTATACYDMIGNVWEWTTDFWFDRAPCGDAPKACCVPQNPRGGPEAAKLRPAPAARSEFRARFVKGGSHLCAPNYCRRYRPAARHAQPIDTSMSHVGFRVRLRSPFNGQSCVKEGFRARCGSWLRRLRCALHSRARDAAIASSIRTCAQRPTGAGAPRSLWLCPTV